MSALAHRFMGQTLNLMGSLVEARMHLEQTIALCSANESSVATYRRFGIDDQVGAMFNLARTLLLLGYPDQSAGEAERAVARARSLALPFTTALALGHAALVGILTCDQRRVEVHTDAAISYSAHHSLPEPEQKARFLKGVLLAQTGNPKVGLEMMKTAMTDESNALQGDYRSLYFGYMADAHLRLAEPRIGLDLLNRTIADAEATGEKFFLAELFRLRAQMLRALGEREEAEADLERALAVARDQEARWWELRAATSLAGLWCGNGRSSRARSMLRSIYGWFNEGLETPVLRAAREQLED
jgi:predicted ATPase